MRIGFDAKRAFFNKSGLGNYSRNVINYLLKFFPENKYYLFSPKRSENIFFENSENIFTVFPENFLHKKISSLWRSHWISDDIKKKNIEIFHGLSNELPKSINRSNTKSVITIHDLIFIRYPELYNPIDRYIYKQKAKYSCDIADKIIAISQQTKNDIIEFLNIDTQKIEVVYQGCNPVYYKKFDQEYKFSVRKKFDLPVEFILNVGTIEPRKNVLSAIKAIHLKNIDLPLVIVGKKTKYFNEIQNYIKKNKIENQIQFLDNVSLQELAAIYQLSEIFIYPSVFEGFGIPIIEALNSGIPVITSKGGCFSEAGGKDSIYINPLDIEEIGNAILELLKNHKIKKNIIENGYKFVENFREEKIAFDIMNIYKSII
jgi:glycosyltransferase involved in cell wall biosynthesis